MTCFSARYVSMQTKPTIENTKEILYNIKGLMKLELDSSNPNPFVLISLDRDFEQIRILHQQLCELN